GARVALPAAAAAELVVDPPRLVSLGPEDVEAARRDHLLPFLGAGLPVLLEDLLVTRVVLLRGLLELLADLLDRRDVGRAVLLVAPRGGGERLLVGAAFLRVLPLALDVVVLGAAVLRAQRVDLAVAGAVSRPALHEQCQLHHREAALVLRAAL